VTSITYVSMQRPLLHWQSTSDEQLFPRAHFSRHESSQSTSVSSKFITPSKQVGDRQIPAASQAPFTSHDAPTLMVFMQPPPLQLSVVHWSASSQKGVLPGLSVVPSQLSSMPLHTSTMGGSPPLHLPSVKQPPLSHQPEQWLLQAHS
jgi:hypothetical protein